MTDQPLLRTDEDPATIEDRLRLVRIGRPPLELEVLPGIGARLHRLRAFGRDLMRTPDDPATHLADTFYWGGFTMAPWCNRIEAEPTDVGGRSVALGSNFPDGSALHGQVYERPWRQVDESTFTVSGGRDGWPWRYTVRLEIAVDGPRATLAYTLTNLDDMPMPGGVGIHPWFLSPDDLVIDAQHAYADNFRTSAEPVDVAGELDLRAGGPMPVGLDGTWATLGDPAVAMRWRDGDLRLTMRGVADEVLVVAASPPGIDAIAVEAQTHAPQGLRRLLGGEPSPLRWLDPGASLGLRVELAVEQAGSGDPAEPA